MREKLITPSVNGLLKSAKLRRMDKIRNEKIIRQTGDKYRTEKVKRNLTFTHPCIVIITLIYIQ
jgi:hypothetical protein